MVAIKSFNKEVDEKTMALCYKIIKEVMNFYKKEKMDAIVKGYVDKALSSLGNVADKLEKQKMKTP